MVIGALNIKKLNSNLNRTCATEQRAPARYGPRTSTEPTLACTPWEATTAGYCPFDYASKITAAGYRFKIMLDPVRVRYKLPIHISQPTQTRIWHVPAKHSNRMDARAHSSSLAECAPRFMTRTVPPSCE